MSTIWANTGLLELLAILVNDDPSQTLWLELFVSNTTPSHTSVFGDFTRCTTSGYARLNLTTAPAVESVQAAGTVQEVWSDATFTFGANAGNDTIFGYMFYGDDSVLYGAEKYVSPFRIPAAGSPLVISPKITLRELGL